MAEMDEIINGKYQIIQQIGQGGMAYVYLAKDLALGRFVALKIIRKGAFPPKDYERLYKRFEIEAKTLARMNHPNIIKIFDYGEFDGSPFLVMEYIDGGTLKQYMGKPLPYNQAAGMLAPVADGLAYAHNRGVLHRDVKPANILIRKDGQAVLSDFGIAKMLEQNESDGTLTETGMGIGTPVYMAPEQCVSKKFDSRADDYSLGMIYFEMCSGVKPYTGTSATAIMLKQMNAPVPDLSDYIANIPARVSAVVSKELSKNPADRYQTTEEFADELHSLSRVKNVPDPVLKKRETENIFGDESATREEVLQTGTAGTQKSAKKSRPVWGIILLLAGAGAAVALFPVIRSKINLDRRSTETALPSLTFTVSPIPFTETVGSDDTEILDSSSKNTPFLMDTKLISSTDTPIPTDTPQSTSTDTPMPTDTLQPTSTDTPMPTDTPLPTLTDTPMPTDTPLPTSTDTPIPTDTPLPTSTDTLMPTDTPLPTSTDTLMPTDTPLPTSTDTPIPTDTPLPTSTDTLMPTDTPLPTSTNTPYPTDTPLPSASPTIVRSEEEIMLDLLSSQESKFYVHEDSSRKDSMKEPVMVKSASIANYSSRAHAQKNAREDKVNLYTGTVLTYENEWVKLGNDLLLKVRTQNNITGYVYIGYLSVIEDLSNTVDLCSHENVVLPGMQAEINEGDVLYLGSYNDDSLQWQVVSVDADDTALLISQYLVNNLPYNSAHGYNTTWKNSTVRSWLNNTFLEETFIEREKNLLLPPQNGCEPTDLVSLLSKNDISDGRLSFADNIYSLCWLIDRFVISSDRAYFMENGSFSDAYHQTVTTPLGIRPLIRLDLNAYRNSQPVSQEERLAAKPTVEVDDLLTKSLGHVWNPTEDETILPGYLIRLGSNNDQWRVLDIFNDDSMLLFSEDIFTWGQYNSKASITTTWENSALRRWLNDDYLNDVFPTGSPEREILLETELENGVNYNSAGIPSERTPATVDSVFLLSVPEVTKYQRIINPLDYDDYETAWRSYSDQDFIDYIWDLRGAGYEAGVLQNMRVRWAEKAGYWLRSQGGDKTRGTVSSDGKFIKTIEVNRNEAIRPAIRVDMRKLFELYENHE